MLLLQQISNDAKVMQTKAEADLKSAATRSDGTGGTSSNERPEETSVTGSWSDFERYWEPK